MHVHQLQVFHLLVYNTVEQQQEYVQIPVTTTTTETIENNINTYFPESTYTQNQTYLGLDTIANQIEGVEPERKSFSKKAHAITFIDSIVNKLVNREGVSPNNITIVGNRNRQGYSLP